MIPGRLQCEHAGISLFPMFSHTSFTSYATKVQGSGVAGWTPPPRGLLAGRS